MRPFASRQIQRQKICEDSVAASFLNMKIRNPLETSQEACPYHNLLMGDGKKHRTDEKSLLEEPAKKPRNRTTCWEKTRHIACCTGDPYRATCFLAPVFLCTMHGFSKFQCAQTVWFVVLWPAARLSETTPMRTVFGRQKAVIMGNQLLSPCAFGEQTQQTP